MDTEGESEAKGSGKQKRKVESGSEAAERPMKKPKHN